MAAQGYAALTPTRWSAAFRSISLSLRMALTVPLVEQ